MNTHCTTTLPENVARYFDASNRFDAEAAAACFTPDANVDDNGTTFVGTQAIRDWVAHTSEEYRAAATVQSAQQEGEALSVVALVAGQFPGSPVELRFSFALESQKIASLSVSLVWTHRAFLSIPRNSPGSGCW